MEPILIEKLAKSIKRKLHIAVRKIHLEWEEGDVAGIAADINSIDAIKRHLCSYIEPAIVSDILQTNLGRIGYCEKLYVKSDKRGKGFGTKLLEALEEEMIECCVDNIYIIADTTEQNHINLIEWYKERGYKLICNENIDYPLLRKTL